MKKINIFIGFSEVANVFSNLLKGFRKLDIDYTFIVYGENIRQYEGDTKKSLFQYLFNQLNKSIDLYKKNIILSKFFYLSHVLLRLPLLVWALIRHNVFIFSYNSSFLGLYDLPILKFFNKKIIYCYFGADGRSPYINGNYILEKIDLDDVYELTKDKYNKHKKIEKYADYIISDYNYSQFFTAQVIDFLYIGIPVDFETLQLDTNSLESENSLKINIVHAPSSKKVKGSEYFSKIIQELKSEGFEINYIELTNVPNRVVLENLVKCDFVLDELYSDAPMAGLATEAAYFGKASVIGGYANFDSRIDEVPPSMYVEPSEIKGAIIKLINDKEFRIELGNKAKQYVKNYRNPEAVANRFLRIINDDIPQEWFFDASKSDYFYGWGVSKEDLKEFLKKYVGKFGKDGLFLSHNPTLESKILEFIKD